MAVTLHQVPAGRLTAGDFVAACRPEDLVYFLLNVGDGDCQLLLLPDDGAGRQLMVVDVEDFGKLDALIAELARTALLPQRATGLIALVVATHPHADHIAGMGRFLDTYASLVEEVWEPAYYVPGAGYRNMMEAIGRHGLRHGQPTSGMTRWIGHAKVLVLSPGINLRNRYDSYGIDVNNSSIALKVEFPGRLMTIRNDDGSFIRSRRQSLILGADAQTLSWSQVEIDFPQLGPDSSIVSQALSKAQGFEPLNADVFKVPHHASKHGLNLELVEKIAPSLSLVSSVGGGGKYNFPHLTAMESLREGVEATAQGGQDHTPDYELGIHYTFGSDDTGAPLGSIAVVMSPGGRKREVWRFGDTSNQDIALTNARRFA
jgi:beta-lactamase superfamily II metal-dependent hydrolase